MARIALEEGSFDDQGIGAPDFLQQLVGIGGIADHDQPGTRFRGPQNLVRRDPTPVRQDDRFAPKQPAPLRPGRNVERGQPLRQHARPRLFLEHEAEVVGTSVRHRECPHTQMIILDDGARLDDDALDLESRRSVWPDDFSQQAADGAERRRAAVHSETVARLQQSQGCDQATDPEQVVEVGVGEQDAVEPTEPKPAPEQLTLGPLTAVQQEPAVPVQDDQRW